MRASQTACPADAEQAASEEVLWPRSRKRTDLGNAERFADHAEGQLLWVFGQGWLCWDGKRWKRDETNRVARVAADTVRSIYREASDLSKAASAALDEAERKKWADQADEAVKHAARSESCRALNAMIKLGQSQERLVLKGGASALDAEPDLLNVQNGILGLRNLELSEHDPSRCITKVARAEYHSNAEAPFFEECVEKALPDKDVRRWVQKAAGYSMRGQYSEYLFIPFGGGANLKSTLLYGMRYALGDYAAEAASDLLVARREWGAAAESALAGLRGSRFVTTIETEQGKRMAEVLVKQLTGEQDITAKFMRQDYFSYQNQAAVWLATNHKPIVQGMDFAIWRRVKLIPFEYQVPEDERLEHDDVNRRLQGESDGILRWLVEGLEMYLEDGGLTPEPKVITDATNTYRKEMDSLGEWLEDECVVEEGAWEEYAPLRESYVKWCRNSREPLGDVRFRQELDRRGFVSKRGRRGERQIRYRAGLRLQRVPDY